ncbi:vacuolar membrane-associated protein Iml1 [archaeon]|nr:MAG: vacuolar membrane-associated protein Iml1 [archaeon]
MYFEKFLQEFVSPVFDSWKALGVSHMLTVIFFARTFYLDRVSQKTHPGNVHTFILVLIQLSLTFNSMPILIDLFPLMSSPDLYAKRSFAKNSSGFYQQDHFQIVIENVADYDKVSQIKLLRQQFWEFAGRVNWRACKDPEKEFTSRLTVGTAASVEENEESKITGKVANKAALLYAVPSDAVHGNVLEAINASLNILEKHYMDRDLNRTGNSIVLISVGPGVFKVKPTLAQITKQRMLDSAFGIDFISLSRPPVHVVPLFLVDGKAEGVGMTDFYEMPHWIRVSYVDCKNKQNG